MIKIVWKCINIIAISPKRGMEQAEIMDTFWTYHLLPDFLLDGPRMKTDGKVVLNHFPGNAGDVRRLPGKHIDIRPQESNERAFLFGVQSGADGESTTSAVLFGG